ncbi:MAG: cysteine--tRNA ligase [Candidatus Bipolaricaulota bacterium]
MRLQSTLSRKMEELKPADGTVHMYVCGPTVYDRFHIGNARPFLVFDALRRYLESRGLTVVYVQNITDIEDKVIARAAEEGRTSEQVAAYYTEKYFKDCEALGIKPPTHSPRATEYVPQMIELIQGLLDKGHAYVVNGDVYFSVASFAEYGKLSGRDLEELESGARIAISDRKHDPLDFTLWKSAKPGEPSWPSPWGEGRPGWHTECVAMVQDILGETADIHAGGYDLVFPHHENELAQAEALTGKPLARIWLHNGLLTVRGQRMGKSLGNFEYAHNVVERHGTEPIRYFYLSRDWRKPLDFSDEWVEEAGRAVQRVYSLLWEAESLPDEPPTGEGFLTRLGELEPRFHEALEEDFNTAGALGVLQEIVGEAHRHRSAEGDPGSLRAAAALVRRLAEPLGLFQESRPTAEGLTEELINLLVDLRGELRSQRLYPLADQVRDRLAELGVELRDGPHGTVWSISHGPRTETNQAQSGPA